MWGGGSRWYTGCTLRWSGPIENLIIHDEPSLRSPILVAAFAGWSDAHEAASRAVRFLVRRLPARKFAEIEPEEFYVFTRMRPVVQVSAEGERTIHWPRNNFYSWYDDAGDRDLILFSGTEPQLRWKAYTEAVLEVVRRHGVQLVISVGSLLDAVPHTRRPRITGTANADDLAEVLEGRQVTRTGYQGPTGIGTALMDACRRKGVAYATLWGHSPHYLQTSSNVRVTDALLRRLVPLLELPVSLAEMAGASQAFESQVSQLLADNAEIRSYVQRLEERYDQALEPDEDEPLPDLPSAQVAIEEVEEFLRRQHPEESAGDPP